MTPHQPLTVEPLHSAVSDLLSHDDDNARAYLIQHFLGAAMLRLWEARRDAGLTQAQVAEAMHTRQSAVARWEADLSGSISLRKYAEFALACGTVPLEIMLAPLQQVRQFTMERPEEPTTPLHFAAWYQSTVMTPSDIAISAHAAALTAAPTISPATLQVANTPATAFLNTATHPTMDKDTRATPAHQAA
jgi:transcriptional regulator with XRE-family HTH domain